MIAWLKSLWIKPIARIPKCQHYKKVGEKYPDNMEQILKFSPYKNGDEWDYPFGFSQCNNCGKRSFSAMHLHMMGNNTVKYLDDFIDYKIDINSLVKYFDTMGYKYKLLNQGVTP